jgi:hypothetical protein
MNKEERELEDLMDLFGARTWERPSNSDPYKKYKITEKSDGTFTCVDKDSGKPCMRWLFKNKKGGGNDRVCKHIQSVILEEKLDYNIDDDGKAVSRRNEGWH